jgi:hypothetical protein
MLSDLFCPAADILALVEEQKPSDAGASEALPPTVSCNTWLRKDLEASHEATSAISVGSELARLAPRAFAAIRPVSE